MVEKIESQPWPLSVDDLRQWFPVFNQTYFGGRLTEPKWKINTRKSAVLGYFKRDRSNHLIAVSVYRKLCRTQYEATLLHEMIHLWQCTVLREARGGHGVSFKAKASEIERLSGSKYIIKRCVRLPQDSSDSPMAVDKPVEGFLFVWPDGDSLGICRCRLQSAGYLFQMILGPRYENIVLYRCKGTRIARLRQSVKVAHCYKCSAQAFETEIAPMIIEQIKLPAWRETMFKKISKKISKYFCISK
ncbi:MAG: SprT-like domain-containing protein [Paludibacteraceae bacterium]|nr:SprT-like domain-containing protein [Paludibacteraceae bacterium]